VNTPAENVAADWPDWLKRPEASQYLWGMHGIQVGPASLANLASKGGGPAFHKDGFRVSYSRKDLDEWAPTRRQRVKSTSEVVRKPKAQPDANAQPADGEAACS
jgi:hypothetical protein